MNLQAIQKAFSDMSVPDLSAFYTSMETMRDIYLRKPPWRRIKKNGLYAKGEREMEQLGAAKALCDEFAALTFSEQVELTVNDATYQAYLQKTLQRCGFWKRFPSFLSKAYAVGGGTAKCFAQDGKARFVLTVADSFLPIAWDGDAVTDCVFETVSRQKGHWYTLLERHSMKRNDANEEQGAKTHVVFKALRSHTRGDSGMPCSVAEAFPTLPDTVDYNTDTPMYCYFRPATGNNVEWDCLLGASVYANAIDTLHALDTAFDSLHREFILGKKRIIVPAGCIRYVVDPVDGTTKRYFDADDEAFVAFKAEDNTDLKITDNTITLRITEHVAAINALLNLLCFQTGLSAGSLSFESTEGIKTATEVVSQNSKTARTAKANKNIVTEFLEELAHSIFALGVALGDLAQRDCVVTVGWPDNIVIDDNTMIDNNVKLVSAGLKSKLKAIMEVQKCNEAEAKKEMQRIQDEQMLMTSPDEMFPPTDDGNHVVPIGGGDADDGTGG